MSRPIPVSYTHLYPVPFEEITIGQVSPVGGRCAFLAVRTAIDWALARRIGCVVTAPLNKEAMRRAGYQYAGHTEIFGEFTLSLIHI